MLKRVYVFIHLDSQWVPCGLLEYFEQGRQSSSIFRYGRKYLQRPDAISIDPRDLPLQDTTFSTPEGFAVFNGIRDAGPDRWGRYLLDKKFGRSLTEIEYIAAASSDRVGALGFSDSLQHSPGIYEDDGSFTQASRKKRLDLAQCLGAVDDASKSAETKRLLEYLSYGPSLGGARPKASVELDGSLYLAKFTLSLDQKDESLIEYATMSLAKKCGLNVPEIRLEKIDGRSVYLIKRFDRIEHQRIPFISGLTVTGLHETDYASWSYFALVDAVIRYAQDPAADLRELYRRLIFNIAVYNNDDHLRNFGFLGGQKDRWSLSPLYDVVPTLIHSETYALAMTLGREGKRASYSNAISMCERFRLTSEEAEKIINEVKDVVSGWKDHFAELGVKAHEIESLKKSFSEKP
jgi:serine/threonine-protein kinase HipA